MQQIGTALLPTAVTSRALPAPAEAAPEAPAAAANTALKTESAPQSQPQAEAQAVEQPTPEVNSATQKEVEAKSHFRALSPYPSVSVYF